MVLIRYVLSSFLIIWSVFHDLSSDFFTITRKILFYFVLIQNNSLNCFAFMNKQDRIFAGEGISWVLNFIILSRDICMVFEGQICKDIHWNKY